MSGGPQKRAFVTGATGGIGSVLCERLSAEGWHVLALARAESDTEHILRLDGIEIIDCDLLDEPALTRFMRGCDAVFHLAAMVHAAPNAPESAFERVNVTGTRSVVNAAVAARVPTVVFFSTVAVFPESDAVFDDLSPTEPATAYGSSKLAAERIVLDASNLLNATVLRLPVVYGPRDRGNVRRLIDAIARGRFVIPGSGENIKTMVAVDNVVESAMHVATDLRAAGKIYIVTDDRASTLAEIVATISRALGKGTPPRFPKAILKVAGHAADGIRRVVGLNLPLSADQIDKVSGNTRYSGDRIHRELGILFKTKLEEGMAAAVAGYLRDREKPASHPRDAWNNDAR